jgi:DNA-binding NtrC family response regulator
LSTYAWPGNVRELRNAVQRAYVMAADETIDDSWLPHGPLASGAAALPQASPVAAMPAVPAPAPVPLPSAPGPLSPLAGVDPPSVTLPIGTSVAEAERILTLATLRHFHHHKELTAATLGISLKTLYNRLKEYAAGEGGAGDASK